MASCVVCIVLALKLARYSLVLNSYELFSVCVFLVFNLNHGGHIGNALRNTPPNRTVIYINIDIDILIGVLYHPHCPLLACIVSVCCLY